MAAGQLSSLYVGICERSRGNPELLQVPRFVLKTRTAQLAVNPLVQLGLLKVGITSEPPPVPFNVRYSMLPLL